MFDRDSQIEGVSVRPASNGSAQEAASLPARILRLQRSAGNASVATALQRRWDHEPGDSPVTQLMRSGGGQPLEMPVRRFMESRLGADFGDVRIHTGAKATDAARSVQAHAYTAGTDVVFQDGQYNPATPAGQKMLAHELTHVIQQKAGPVDGTPAAGGLSISDPSDRFERAAEASAERVMAGAPPMSGGVGPAPGIQRQDEQEELQAFSVQRQGEEEAEEEVQE